MEEPARVSEKVLEEYDAQNTSSNLETASRYLSLSLPASVEIFNWALHETNDLCAQIPGRTSVLARVQNRCPECCEG